MKGWFLVAADGLRDDAVPAAWVQLTVGYAAELRPKTPPCGRG
jgi:hypothetical protein